ncbi:MAG: protein-glutamate O-methyltransferase CheR [Desulfobacterales bacterium]|nr:protein-glutamate O-methyltransferase CheR [Desulfobacterales bacterium]
MDLTEKHYRELFDLVYQASGIKLNSEKKALVSAKIAKRLRVTKLNSAAEYVAWIKKDPIEFAEFIDTVTTNHTYFFRENVACEYLVSYYRGKKEFQSREIKIWSAASSTGEEPYSVAVQFLAADLQFSMIATDIAHTVLDVARKGIYHKNRATNIPIAFLHQFFQKGQNQYTDYIRIKPHVQKLIRFEEFNLITDSPKRDYFDVIFCRNVMIYFDSVTIERLVESMYHSLKKTGFFVIGQSENLVRIKHRFTSVPKVSGLYEKK